MHRARSSPSALALALAACQPGGLFEAIDRCAPDRPAPGEVVVGRVACAEMTVPGGEARFDDTWFANHWIRAVVRHPQASLGLVGVGGATVVDAAPWGQSDALHEVAPLIGGGWLDIDDASWDGTGLTVQGVVVSLPDRPALQEGQRAEVRLSLGPDDAWIRFEGSDGLWLNPSGAPELLDGWLWTDAVVYGHDGASVEDLGGAVRVAGATGLLVANPVTALAQRAGPEGRVLSGSAPGADRIRLYRGAEAVGTVPVDDDGAFSAIIAAEVDGVVAEAAGAASSPRAVPGEALELALLGAGALELRFAWGESAGRAVQVAWRSLDGREGEVQLGATGGSVALGAGSYALDVSAGPSFWPATVAAETDGNGTPTVIVELEPRFEPGGHVLAAFGVRANRSRAWRGTDPVAAATARGLGADWVVLAAEDEVPSATDDPTNFPPIPHENGSWSIARDGTWQVLSWPWTADADRPGHGAVDTRDRSPADGLAAAQGGPGRDRHTVVDLGWLALAPSPWAVRPAPEGVRLVPPGAAGPATWQPWFHWLDAAITIHPVGALAWVPVPDPSQPSSEDVMQGFTAGRAVATTGPWLELRVGDASPGDVAPTDPTAPQPVEVVLAGATGLDHLALIGTGGAELAHWDLAGVEDRLQVSVEVLAGRWVVAMAWDESGEDFVATGPVWLDPP